jgi:hypothetical protein
MRTEEKAEEKKNNKKNEDNDEGKDNISYRCLVYETAKQTITR